MKARVTTDIGTYTLIETIGEDGRVRLALEVSNPPKGFDERIWSWHGRPSALSKPFRAEGPIRVEVEHWP